MIHKQMVVTVLVDVLAHSESQFDDAARKAATVMREALERAEEYLPAGANISDIYVGVPQPVTHSGVGPGQEWQGQQGVNSQFGGPGGR